ncbi:MAG TPA: hypothetical protein VLA88_03215, partial [Candidatus Saccharimonadales bacterium]|nr:hypothetical protein [Candidatus Saccharimonadales bacterium]
QTDEQTCRQRATKRNPRRSPDDVYPVSLTEHMWSNLAKQFAQPVKEAYMVISGKHAFSTQAKMVLRKLSTPHAQEATTVRAQEREQAAPVSRETPRTPRAPERPDARPGRRSVLIS